MQIVHGAYEVKQATSVQPPVWCDLYTAFTKDQKYWKYPEKICHYITEICEIANKLAKSLGIGGQTNYLCAYRDLWTDFKIWFWRCMKRKRIKQGVFFIIHSQ